MIEQVFVCRVECLQRFILLFGLADQVELGERRFEQRHGTGTQDIRQISRGLDVVRRDPTEWTAMQAVCVITRKGLNGTFFCGQILAGLPRDNVQLSDDPGPSGGNHCGNLVADVEFFDDVLYVIVNGAFAQAEDSRNVVSRLAHGGKFHDFQLPGR